MALHQAKRFITVAMEDAELRDRMNSAPSVDALLAVVAGYGFPFTPQELEEAYTNRLTLCQFEEQADRLKEFKQWWDLLLGFLGAATSGEPVACSNANTCTAGGCAGCGN